MSAVTVAMKDYRDAVQSRALWALLAAFVVVLLITTYAYVELPEMFGPTGEATFAGLIFFTTGITGLFVPLAAIIVCFKALAGERELGSIKILLSLPVSRTHVLLGKVIGRAAVLVTAVVFGLLIGLGFGALLLGTVNLVAFILFVLVSVVFAGIYSSIVVGLSATTGSTTRATTLAIGFFVVFELVWDVVPLGVVYVINGFSLPTEFPDWVFLVTQLSPATAYFTSVIALLPDAAADAGAAVGGTGMEIEPGQADPFYVTPEAGLVFLAFWFVVPLVLGYHRFTTADI